MRKKGIEKLALDPFPQDIKRVVNQKEKVFRVRVGDYRIQYMVLSKDLIIDLRFFDIMTDDTVSLQKSYLALDSNQRLRLEQYLVAAQAAQQKDLEQRARDVTSVEVDLDALLREFPVALITTALEQRAYEQPLNAAFLLDRTTERTALTLNSFYNQLEAGLFAVHKAVVASGLDYSVPAYVSGT